MENGTTDEKDLLPRIYSGSTPCDNPESNMPSCIGQLEGEGICIKVGSPTRDMSLTYHSTDIQISFSHLAVTNQRYFQVLGIQVQSGESSTRVPSGGLNAQNSSGFVVVD